MWRMVIFRVETIEHGIDVDGGLSETRATDGMACGDDSALRGQSLFREWGPERQSERRQRNAVVYGYAIAPKCAAADVLRGLLKLRVCRNRGGYRMVMYWRMYG